jgi:uncharacterized protein Yka (UPF0111/DUF47 family)
MEDEKTRIWRKWLRRVFPEVPDFASLLARQGTQVQKTINDLVEYLQHPAVEIQDRLRHDQEEAGRLRDENMLRLQTSFATPFDREDIYRAIEELDWIVVHTRRTARELEVLQLSPDNFMREICLEIATGVGALQAGFTELGADPEAANKHAEAARRIDLRARHIYEQALGELFEGDDVIDMMKRREIYHHLADGAKRVRKTAEVLQDILVKTA